MKLIDKLKNQNLLDEVPEDVRYLNSPFRKVKLISNAKTKGARYEKISHVIYQTNRKHVEKAPKKIKDYDRVVDELKVEIKGATLVKGQNHFIFNQIRSHQNYDVIHFTCIYPLKIVILEMTKQEIINKIESKDLLGQHGGKDVDSGTYVWIKSEKELLDFGARIVYTEEFEPFDWQNS